MRPSESALVDETPHHLGISSSHSCRCSVLSYPLPCTWHIDHCMIDHKPLAWVQLVQRSSPAWLGRMRVDAEEVVEVHHIASHKQHDDPCWCCSTCWRQGSDGTYLGQTRTLHHIRECKSAYTRFALASDRLMHRAQRQLHLFAKGTGDHEAGGRKRHEPQPGMTTTTQCTPTISSCINVL